MNVQFLALRQPEDAPIFVSFFKFYLHMLLFVINNLFDWLFPVLHIFGGLNFRFETLGWQENDCKVGVF